LTKTQPLGMYWLMKAKTNKCPKCGGKCKSTYEAPYQEYAGASVQGGYYYIMCAKCGHEATINADLSGFNYRENRRGW